MSGFDYVLGVSRMASCTLTFHDATHDYTPCTKCLTCTGHLMHIWGMKLAKYMEIHQLTDEMMAELIGKDRSVVSRYRRGELVPPSDVIWEIQSKTNLAVQFNDWFSKSGEAA